MKLIAPQPLVTTRAADEIRAAILDGSLLPGSRVRQEGLAAQLGVSREPIRKALLVLEWEGLVCNVGNSGAIVAPLDLSLISEIYEFREAIECSVAARVAGRTDFGGAALRRVIAQGRNAVRVSALGKLIDLDWTFHSELYRASGNRVVVEVMQAQWSHIRRAMLATLKTRGYRDRVWDEHEAILEAILSRDVAHAQELAAAHTRGARAFLTGGSQPAVEPGQQEAH
jgi:DNA-binding GntR family transcriptional regulator